MSSQVCFQGQRERSFQELASRSYAQVREILLFSPLLLLHAPVSTWIYTWTCGWNVFVAELWHFKTGYKIWRYKESICKPGRKPLAHEGSSSLPSEHPDFATLEDLIIRIFKNLCFDSPVILIFFTCKPQALNDVSWSLLLFSSFFHLLGKFQTWGRRVRFKIITFSQL